MRNLGLITVLLAGLMLTGCLSDNGSTEVPSTGLNNEDFSVITDPNPPPSDNSGGVVTPPGSEIEGFDLNKGAVLTASTALQLDFFPPFAAAYISISEDEKCSSTAWRDYDDSAVYNSVKKNQLVPISVKYRDDDGRSSPCYVRSIYIDQIGPNIVFAKYPTAPVEEGADVEIIFNVTDDGAGVDTVECKFAGISKACGAGTNKVIIPKMAAGDYTLSVAAKDKLGFSSSGSISFKVTSLYKSMVHNVKVNEYNKVDILFVIDNSGSMEYEQKSMASRVRNFLDVVKGLDWQIAVTTTDPSNKTYGDGRLVTMKGLTNTFILNSSMSDATARDVLSNTLQRTETGSGSEQGIYAAYRAVERSVEGTNSNFIRSDAQLAVVLISDEDESANGVKNDPANFVKYIQTQFNGQKAMSYHSVITRPGDEACLNGEGYSYGHRFAAMAQMTGGVIGDVCAADYSAQVQGIAEGVRNTLKSITLSCTPVVDSSRAVVVKKDGVVYTGSRQIQGLNVVFDQMLPAGNYEVNYTCLK